MSDITPISHPDVPGFTPYHSGGALWGSKAGLLLDCSIEDLSPLTPSEVIPRALPSRRDILRAGAIGGGGILLVGLRPQRARADFGAFLFFVGAAVLTAGINWLVRRLLDNAFPPNPTPADLGLRRVYNPRPSQDRFHDSFVEPYEVTNRNVWIPSRTIKDYDLELGLNHYLLQTDLNGTELLHLERAEEEYGGPLLPADLRRRYSGSYHERAFRRIRRDYRRPNLPELRESDVQYVQTFRDKKKREHVGFGVIWGGKARLLLD